MRVLCKVFVVELEDKDSQSKNIVGVAPMKVWKLDGLESYGRQNSKRTLKIPGFCALIQYKTHPLSLSGAMNVMGYHLSYYTTLCGKRSLQILITSTITLL